MVNLGNISRPVSTFIEKISDAVTGIAKPWQMRRVAQAEAEEIRILAQAEADAALIAAEQEFQITDRHRVAFFRLIEEEAVKQSIIQNIVLKAIPLIDENNARPEDMDEDWIRNFFDKGRIISDEDVQALLARLLAGEANSPGSFSRKTVNLLADLDKRDAELFQNLCRFKWIVLGRMEPLVFDPQHEIYDRYGITFDSLGQLETLGLIHFGSVGGFKLTRLPKNTVALYFGRPVSLVLKKDVENDLATGRVFFTEAGRQLAQICETTPDDEFFDYVYKKWASESLVSPKES